MIATFYLALTAGAVFAAPASSSLSVDVEAYETTAEERKLSEKTVAEVEKYFEFSSNPLHQTRVEVIVNRLKPYMQRNLPYKVFIIDHEMINAFAIAGGNMYVSTGMLGFVKSDLELAGVIAHEMVHADRSHVVTQMARNQKMTLLAILAMVASKGQGAAILAASALQVAVMGAYSIDIEKEADARGIDALQLAGYNPVGMVTLQERLLEEDLKRPLFDLGIYQTHPGTDERIAAAAKYMDEHKIAINRKHSLGVLRASVDTVAGRTVLKLDDVVVWRGADDERTRLLFRRVGDDLWRFLQLETVPYDIMVGTVGGERALLVAGKVIVREAELPAGADALAELREQVQAALTSARHTHPMADYFQ